MRDCQRCWDMESGREWVREQELKLVWSGALGKHQAEEILRVCTRKTYKLDFGF